MADKEVTEMELSELFVEFKSNILYDAHGFQRRYNSSVAKDELLSPHRVAKGTLQAVITHVREITPIDDETEIGMQLEAAWAILIKDMCLKLEIPTDSGPDEWNMLDWCEWAEAQI